MARSDQLRALLTWYLDAGVDEAIDETPQDRFARPARPASDSAPTTPYLAQAIPRVGKPEQQRAHQQSGEKAGVARQPGTPARNAHETAAACATLEELVAAIRAFEGCALKRTATSSVIGDGNPSAALMIVGEAPGAEEDRKGVPFVGPAGRLLDLMLGAIGLDRSGAYITNILPWRPPGNRSPTAEEIAICRPFVERQIELVAPRVLLLVGGISAKALLDRSEGITRLRGTWHQFATARVSEPIDTMATFHPAYLLRQPAAKREAWRDLLAVHERLTAAR